MIPAIQAITNLELPEDKKIELIRLLVSEKPQIVTSGLAQIPSMQYTGDIDGLTSTQGSGGIRTAQR